MQFRQILRALGKKPEGKVKLRELLFKNRQRLTEREYWIIEFIYLKRLSIENVANKFNLSKGYFHSVLNIALTRFETLIDDKEMREIIETI